MAYKEIDYLQLLDVKERGEQQGISKEEVKKIYAIDKMISVRANPPMQWMLGKLKEKSGQTTAAIFKDALVLLCASNGIDMSSCPHAYVRANRKKDFGRQTPKLPRRRLK